MNGFGNGNNYNFRMPPMPPRDFNFNFNNNHPRLGMQIQDTKDSSGVKVQNVLPGSPADKAGLKEGDIITEMNGEKINDVDKVMSKIRSADRSGDFKINALRGKKEMSFDVHLRRPLRTTNI
jgi:S1-C subfamily serine protease